MTHIKVGQHVQLQANVHVSEAFANAGIVRVSSPHGDCAIQVTMIVAQFSPLTHIDECGCRAQNKCG